MRCPAVGRNSRQRPIRMLASLQSLPCRRETAERAEIDIGPAYRDIANTPGMTVTANRVFGPGTGSRQSRRALSTNAPITPKTR